MRFNEIKKQLSEGWATGSDRVTLPDEPSTYWAGKGQLQDEYNRLYDELVPSQGKADTIEGEVLRASSKIVYRHYNDGDEFNEASFDQLEPYIGKVTSYDDLAHKAVEFAVKANGNYTPNPDWDSLDAMDYGPVDDDDDYDDDDYEEDDSWDDDDEDEPHPGWDDEDEDLDEAWQDGADLISQWNIPHQEWTQFEEAVESVIAATESDEAWEQFWKVINDDLQHLDRPVREAFERGLGSMDVSETTEYVLNGLRNGYESAGTEPRAALGLLTDIIEDGVRKLGMNEDWKKNLGTAALGAALAFGGAKAANAGQGPEQAPQKAAAAATQQAQAQNPYHNDLGVLVGVAQSKGGMQVLGKILSADQIQQVKAAYAKAKADPNLAKSAQFKQGQQLGFELGNSYADSSSQQMTDLNKRGPSYAGILSPMVVKPGEARSAEDITKVNQANAGKLKQAVTAAYGNMMAGGLQEDGAGVKYGVYKRGGSIGERNGLIKTFDTKEEAQEYAKRQRRHLSPGERKYYKLGYTVKAVKPGEQVDESYYKYSVKNPDGKGGVYHKAEPGYTDQTIAKDIAYAKKMNPQATIQATKDGKPFDWEAVLGEGWESGPEERSYRSRGSDPDAEYDARRQDKADAEAQAAQAKRPQEQYYTLVGRGPNQEPNYAFPGEYDSQDAADKARAKLMADPKTPNPRDIGISKRTRYLDLKEGIESGDPVESAVLSAVQELIQQGHTEVAPEVITNMVVAATSQPFLLKDLVDCNNNSAAVQHYVDSINPTKVKFSNEILTVKNEDPAKDKAKAQSGVSNMAARAASRPRLGEDSVTPLRDREDYDAKKKALQDIQSDPDTAKDKELSLAVMRRLAGLEQQRKDLK